MKRLLTLLALVLCSCAETFVGEEIARPNSENLPDLTASFADEDATRTYVENNKYLRWHEDDRLTAFYGNTLNRQYKFNGATGDNSGTFSLVPDGMLGTGNAFDHIYALYPYNADARITDEGVISLTLPAEQTYAENSFGRGANTMIAVTENLEDTFLAFKNACGYLKLKLYNAEGATIKSIEVKGNSGERLAGAATATIAFGEAPVLAMADDATTSVILNCGEGVALGTTAETATEFWVTLPATTFAEGLTITATDTEGSIFEKSTTNEVVIERNAIQPMAALNTEFTPAGPADNEIWYTATAKISDDNGWDYWNPPFGSRVTSHTFDPETGKGIITFERSITTIKERTLTSSYLTSISIPNSVTTIEEGAFYGAYNIETFNGKFAEEGGRILVSDGTLIAFAPKCGVTEYTIPENITKVGTGAFYNSDRLENIIIGSNVTTIGDAAFNDCSGLTEVIIPDNVTTLNYWAFGACNYLKNITIGSGVTSIEHKVFYMCNMLTNVYIKAAIPPTAIYDYYGWNIFDYNAPERKIYVPAASVEAYRTADYWSTYAYAIGGYDFTNGEIVIPCPQPANNEIWYTSSSKITASSSYPWTFSTFGATVTSNEHDNNTGRGVLTFDRDVTTIGNYAFTSKYLSSIDIPNSVTSIGDYAFQYNNSLKNIAIPDGVTSIGKFAFEYCSSLTSVTIPDSVATIGYAAFKDCEHLTEFKGTYAEDGGRILVMDGKLMVFAPYGLTTYNIPNNVTSIGDTAFMGCKLTSVIIPSSITEIGDRAFISCAKLASVYCMSTTTPALLQDGRTFDNNADGRIIYVPTGSLSTYRSANGWNEYSSYMKVFEYVPTECTSLTITADDVVGNATSTTIYYTAETSGFDCYGVPKSQIVTGTAQSYQFSKNSSTTESIERTITFTYLGQTATTKITQGPAVASYYTISTNDQWRLSTSVSNPDSSLYDGVYESYSNYNKDNGVATMYIDIEGYTEFSIYVRSDAESTYDYVTVSELDSTTQKMSTSGKQNSGTAISNYTKVTYTGIDGGKHRITIIYKKDSSQHRGTDRGYLIIPKNQ